MNPAVQFLQNGPNHAEMTLMLAHGAGTPMDTPFMTTVAKGVAATGIRVLRFEFPYMSEKNRTSKRRPPDPKPILLDSWRTAFAASGKGRTVIGGKSMGGRMASLVADELGATGLVCLGYPFHPSGKPERPRTEHLRSLRTKALFVQGERDPFGMPLEIENYGLSAEVRIHWIVDGNHDLKPRKKSGRTLEQNMAEAIAAITVFLDKLSS